MQPADTWQFSSTELDYAPVGFYRLGWDLADIASYVGWFSAPHARTADTEIAWKALSGALRLKELWPDLL